MISKKVKIESGKVVEIKAIKWKTVKNLKLLSILKKYQDTKSGFVEEEDIDIIVSAALSDDIVDELSLNDALAVFNAVIITTFGTGEDTPVKKQTSAQLPK